MNLLVKVPVIEKKRSLFSKITAYFYLFFYVFLFFNIVFIENNTVTFIIIALTLLSGIILIILHKNYVIGYILFYSDHIVIKTKTIDKCILIKDLKDLKFLKGGFKGEPYILNPGSLVNKDGTNNHLQFKYQQKEYAFEILLKKSNLTEINYLFRHWEKINSNFKVFSEWERIFKKN